MSNYITKDQAETVIAILIANGAHCHSSTSKQDAMQAAIKLLRKELKAIDSLAAKEAELAKAYACIRALRSSTCTEDDARVIREHADTIRKAGEEQ